MATDRLSVSHALVLLGSAALLGGALAFQHLGGYPPCEMCYWQRWPHVAALSLGTLALLAQRTPLRRPLVALAALAVLVSAAIGAFHAGVEQNWWDGPTTCSAAPVVGSTADIVGAMLATPLVRCDAIAWSLFGISMAGYNFLLSTLIGGGALWLILKRR